MLSNCSAGEDSSESLGKKKKSPLDSKEMKPVDTKGNQPWIFTGRTDAEAHLIWPPDVKSWLTGKVIFPWCWERLKGKGEGGGGWDSEGQWGPGALQSTGSQRSEHNLATEQQSNHTNPHPSPLVTTNLIFFSMTFFKYNWPKTLY